jgi:hypothetical protein
MNMLWRFFIIGSRITQIGKKKETNEICLFFWVDDGVRTHDPRYHKPML